VRRTDRIRSVGGDTGHVESWIAKLHPRVHKKFDWNRSIVEQCASSNIILQYVYVIQLSRVV